MDLMILLEFIQFLRKGLKVLEKIRKGKRSLKVTARKRGIVLEKKKRKKDKHLQIESENLVL